MMNFKKLLTIKIISVIVSMLFLCNTTLYASLISKDGLRVPLLTSNQDQNTDAVKSNKKQITDNITTGLIRIKEALFGVKKKNVKAKTTNVADRGSTFLNSYFDFLERFSVKLEVRDVPLYMPEHFDAPWGVVFPANDWLGSIHFEEIGNKKGVYIGVGAEQNFTFLAHSQIDLAIIVDVNPMLTQVLLPSLGLLIARARNRLEFAALLKGLMFTQESLEQYEQNKRISSLDFHKLMVKSVDENNKDWRSASSRIQETVEYIEYHLFSHLDPALRREAKKFLAKVFGLDPYDDYDEYIKGSKKPSSYQEWLKSHDSLSRVLFLWDWDWLGSEENFQRIKTMWENGQILAVTGDLSGKEFQALSEYLYRESRKEVSVVYLSNVEEWLSDFNHGETRARQAVQRLQLMYDNIKVLPKNSDMLLIRSVRQARIEPYASFVKPSLLTYSEKDLDARYKLWLLLQADWGIEHRVYASKQPPKSYPPIEVLDLLANRIYANTTTYPEVFERNSSLISVIKFLIGYEKKYRDTERDLNRLTRQSLKALIEGENLPKILNFEFEILVYMLESVDAIKTTPAIGEKTSYIDLRTGV